MGNKFQGEFQSAKEPKQAPFSPVPLPPDSASDKMAYVWLTDYVIDTAGLVYHEAGALNVTITPSDVSFITCTYIFHVSLCSNLGQILMLCLIKFTESTKQIINFTPLTPRVKPWVIQRFLPFDSMCDHSLESC